ncbi:hypothetical protein L1887_58794 [Cichorium endivia]|nr:hypothetical protein L1887_58794 [Cichorium endivia]
MTTRHFIAYALCLLSVRAVSGEHWNVLKANGSHTFCLEDKFGKLDATWPATSRLLPEYYWNLRSLK